MRLIELTRVKLLLLLLIFALGTVSFFALSGSPSLVSIDSLKISDYKNGILSGHLKMTFLNESIMRGKIRDLEYTVYYDGTKIAKGNSANDILLKSKKNQSFEGDFELELTALENELENLLLNDSIKLEVSVSGRYGLFRIPFKKNLDQWINSTELSSSICSSMLSEEGMKLDSVKLESFSVNKSVFKVNTSFKNTLPVNIAVKSYSFQIFSEKEHKTRVGRFSDAKEITLAEGEEKSLEATVHCNNIKAGLSGITKVFSGTLDYYVKGIIKVKFADYLINVPLESRFDFNPRTKEITVIK